MRAFAIAPLAVFACLVFTSTGWANNTARAEGTLVAVLDVAKVFERHDRFKARMEAIKGEVELFENSLKEERAALQTRAEQLKEYNPGSLDIPRLCRGRPSPSKASTCNQEKSCANPVAQIIVAMPASARASWRTGFRTHSGCGPNRCASGSSGRSSPLRAINASASCSRDR